MTFQALSRFAFLEFPMVHPGKGETKDQQACHPTEQGNGNYSISHRLTSSP